MWQVANRIYDEDDINKWKIVVGRGMGYYNPQLNRSGISRMLLFTILTEGRVRGFHSEL